MSVTFGPHGGQGCPTRLQKCDLLQVPKTSFEDAHARVMEALRTMSKAEFVESLHRAGVLDAEGKIAPPYRECDPWLDLFPYAIHDAERGDTFRVMAENQSAALKLARSERPDTKDGLEIMPWCCSPGCAEVAAVRLFDLDADSYENETHACDQHVSDLAPARCERLPIDTLRIG